MATVQVDLSEYDMIREAKKKAEEEVNKLVKEIEEYKKKARVIVTTKYAVLGFNKFEMKNTISRVYSQTRDLDRAIEAGINYGTHRVGCIGLGDTPTDSIIDSSSQIVGFDDVRVQVEEKLSKEYKNELDNKIKEYEYSKERYDRKYKSLDEKYLKAHTEEINSITKAHESEIQALNSGHDALVKSLQNKIDSLNNTIKELSKSKEDKIAELTAIIKEAEAKMQELNGPRKGFFSKIFG